MPRHTWNDQARRNALRKRRARAVGSDALHGWRKLEPVT